MTRTFGVRTLGALALTGALVLGSATTASAASRTFTVQLTPSELPAGKNMATAVATITNRASDHRIGAVNLTLPAPFGLESATASQGTATVSSNTVQLRQLMLLPGQSMTANVAVDAPCTNGTFAWTAAGTQDQNFHSGGNNFVLDTANSSLTTTVSGACGLMFVGQPADARRGERLSTEDFTPSGGPIRVAVVDPSGATVKASTAAITVGITDTISLGGTTTVTAVGGVATFSDLTVPKTGFYHLTATSAAGSSTSGDFTVHDQAVACEANSDSPCSGSVAGPDVAFDVTALKGPEFAWLTLSLNQGENVHCPNSIDVGTDWLQFNAPGRAKEVTSTVDEGALLENRPDLEQCFMAPYKFTTKAGNLLYTTTRDGQTVYMGILPNCSDITDTVVPSTPPCVTERVVPEEGEDPWKISFHTPNNQEDPWTRTSAIVPPTIPPNPCQWAGLEDRPPQTPSCPL